MNSRISDPDCFSEKVGSFELNMVGMWVCSNGSITSRYKIWVKPEEKEEIEILPWSTFERACYLVRTIEEDKDWRKYQKILDFLDGK